MLLYKFYVNLLFYNVLYISIHTAPLHQLLRLGFLRVENRSFPRERRLYPHFPQIIFLKGY